MGDLAIQTAGLTRRFANVHAVDDLQLSVPVGAVYGFLGPNGAGKTTTIRMLLGLTRPDHGEIAVFGEPVGRANRRALLRRIGAMVDAPSLYPHLTGSENLRLTQGLTGLRSSSVDRALRIVRLERDAGRLVQAYSQGMRQRLGLAMALLAEPELLILDEPTNGLDPAGIHEIRDLIRGLPVQQGVTVFLSSHLLGEVEQIASHVGIIGRGRRVFEGPLGDLLSRRQERVVIEVDHPVAATAMLCDAGWTARVDAGPSLTLDISGREDIPRIATVLVSGGLAVYRIETVRPSLEDLFLDLTRASNLGFAPAAVAVDE